MPSHIVFTGVDAFVAQVTGPKTVKFSISETAFSPLIDVDLAKNPSTVAVANWATGVDVDETLTTIGPTFFVNGNYIGGVYLAQRLVTQHASILSSWPGPPDDSYQYQLLVRENNGQITRFHGFKARVLGQTQGTIARLHFFRPGTSAPTGHTRWLDLADPTVIDPPGAGFTTIAPNTPAGTVGAVFISTVTIQEGGGGDFPKVPRNLGW
jgi:hypothetical protein